MDGIRPDGRDIVRRLRSAAEDAAGAGTGDPIPRARSRLRRIRVRRIRVTAVASVVAVAAAMLTLQGSSSSSTRPRERLEAGAPSPAATGAPGVAASRPSPNHLPGRPTPFEEVRPSPDVPTGPPTTLSGCPPAMPAAAPSGLRVSLELPKTEALSGEPVTMILRVRNEGPGTVSWPRASDQEYDFWIRRGDTVVWRWSRGRFFAPAAQSTTIQPGDESTHAEVWDQTGCPEASAAFPATPGRYVARALVRTTQGGWWSNPVEFFIR